VGRWEPFRELEAMRNEVQRLLGQLAGAGGGGEARTGEQDVGGWLPQMDVSETEDEIILAFDLPGVPQERIDVEVDESTLTVRGTRERVQDERGERFHRVERRFGEFTRSVPLPPGVDEAGIKASYRNGVLEIRLPKPKQDQPRRIEVGGAAAGPPSSEDES
jgi:HSP20 family protein